MNNQEKRRSARFDFTELVGCKSRKKVIENIMTVNISIGGILLQADVEAPRFKEINLEIPMADVLSEPIRCKGGVVREIKQMGKYLWGVEFIEILPRDQNRILDFFQ